MQYANEVHWNCIFILGGTKAYTVTILTGSWINTIRSAVGMHDPIKMSNDAQVGELEDCQRAKYHVFISWISIMDISLYGLTCNGVWLVTYHSDRYFVAIPFRVSLITLYELWLKDIDFDLNIECVLSINPCGGRDERGGGGEGGGGEGKGGGGGGLVEGEEGGGGYCNDNFFHFH